MSNKYIIVGGGPTGLLLSLLLGLSNYDVLLIEKEAKLGGSWKVEWKDGFFTENSPRILHSGEKTFNKLLSYLNITDSSEFNYIYGNIVESNLKLARFFIEHFTLYDWYKFIIASIYYRFNESKLTVESWINSVKLSKKGGKAIRTFSIAISDKSDNVMINDMFGSVEVGYFYGLANPEKWINRIEEKLKRLDNVKIYTNSEVLSIQSNKNKVINMSVKLNGIMQNIYAEHYIITLPPSDLVNIVHKSDLNIKNNWMEYNNFINWCDKSSYIGFGFQLHFKEKVRFPKSWCWSCRDEWVIMILPVSDYAKKYSYDNKIKTVWSACIVDMDKTSSYLNKTPNECNLNEILSECKRLIYKGYNDSLGLKIPNYELTTSYGLKKINNKWVSKHTAFSRNELGYLQIKGNISNLYSVGPHNKLDTWSIVTINRALDSALNFIKKEKNNALCFYKKSLIDYVKNTVYLVILFYIIKILFNALKITLFL